MPLLNQATSSLSREAAWRWALAALVAAAVFAAFAPALLNGFVDWDDGFYIVDNVHIRSLSLANIRWMLSDTSSGLWQPLTWLSLALDYAFWGLEPGGFHLTNVALHAAVAVLFYFFCARLFKRARPEVTAAQAAAAAAAAALFFAVHPLRVESVAWATERKDVLSGFFFMAAMICYLEDLEIAGLIAYAFAMSAKISAATLPAVLLILEIYPLRRPHRKALLSLAPYFCVSVVGSALSIAAGMLSGNFHSFSQPGTNAWKVGQSLYSLLFYFRKTLWPSSLSAYYPPLPWFGSWSWEIFASAALIAGSVAALYRWRGNRPAIGVAFACYTVMILPVSGIFQHGLAHSACDRYSYLPTLGFAALFGAVFLSAGRKTTALMAVWLTGLGIASWRQCAVWRDSTALWSHAAQAAPSAVAFNNLAMARGNSGQVELALSLARRAIALDPSFGPAYENLANALYKLDKHAEAEKAFRLALSLEPQSAVVAARLGALLSGEMGARRELGISLLTDAIERGAKAETRNDLAAALLRKGDSPAARREYRAALKAEPDNAEAHVNLGLMLDDSGEKIAARQHYKQALRTPKHRAAAHLDWGNSLLTENQLEAAGRHFKEALRLDPSLAEAQVNLGNVLARQGHFDEAAARYRAALRINPRLSAAAANLDAVQHVLSR